MKDCCKFFSCLLSKETTVVDNKEVVMNVFVCAGCGNAWKQNNTTHEDIILSNEEKVKYITHYREIKNNMYKIRDGVKINVN